MRIIPNSHWIIIIELLIANVLCLVPIWRAGVLDEYTLLQGTALVITFLVPAELFRFFWAEQQFKKELLEKKRKLGNLTPPEEPHPLGESPKILIYSLLGSEDLAEGIAIFLKKKGIFYLIFSDFDKSQREIREGLGAKLKESNMVMLLEEDVTSKDDVTRITFKVNLCRNLLVSLNHQIEEWVIYSKTENHGLKNIVIKRSVSIISSLDELEKQFDEFTISGPSDEIQILSNNSNG